MRSATLGALLVPALSCGCDGNDADGHGGRVNNPCAGLPGLSQDRATDRTGEANTRARVRRVRDSYGDAILQHCRESNGHAIGRIGTNPDLEAKDHVIVVYLERGEDLPAERTLFLDGVPLRYQVTGEIRAL